MSDTFDLAALIRAVSDESDDTDPEAIAKLVHDRIRRADRDAALAQALPHLVRAHFRRNAPSFLPPTPFASQGPPDTQRSGAGGGSPSRKVAGIREAWRTVLRQRISVGEGYKFLATCTVTDLEWAAGQREVHARLTLARAQQLRTLASLLTEHGVETVGELPDAVLRPALAEDAA